MSAEIAAGMLNANGVHAEVFGQTSSYPSINAAIDSVEVKVNAEDYELAKKYLSEAKMQGNHSAGSLLARLQREEINKYRSTRPKGSTKNYTPHKNNPYNKGKSTYSSYKKEDDYSSSSTQISSSDDGCFITTATCESMGKPDDCEELTAFRKYRDETLRNTSEGQALIAEYYRIAPDIVKKISLEPNADEIYGFLYDSYIRPGYNLLREGKGDEAKALYAKGVKLLADKYGIVLTATIPTDTLL